MNESKQRIEALEEAAEKMIDDEGGEDEEDEESDEVDDDDDDDDGEGEVGEEKRRQVRVLAPLEAKLVGPQSETLASNSSSLQFSESDLPSYFATSSHLLSEVPVDYALLRPLESPNFKDQVGISHQQALASVMTEAAQAQLQNQVLSPGYPTSSELSPTSVTQSISSGPSPTLLDQKLSPVVSTNTACISKVEQQNSSNQKSISVMPVVKTPSTDGYNWRKYGQKQVKSPQGSRSYYRCTYSDCHAKKIEFCDHSNHVIDVISKGQHNHDPPRRINCTRECSLALPDVRDSTAHQVRMLSDSDPSTSSRELIQETPVLRETKRHNSSGSDGTAEIGIKEEHVDEPEPKRRVKKKSNSPHSGSLFKPGKKPKIVVHAAGDVGISGDGYRWRKYGQKMVKGNPHPRNYYRCTSAGCPVRKHIERDVDNTSALIITYKGIHDHDMPVPKKRHGPPSAPLVAAAAPVSMNNSQLKKTDANQEQVSATQWSVDTEGELMGEAVEAGEEKAMESARTLLSIGFEIKQC
ncbi:probable WRKY transcription factor 32 [Actinidia eriantha]|uniref:probable WRKY transcription factor 32 n=1 Tax=Actinidia eriantha TaxID=165200 RepID=UPI0025865A90|nr:probable WRKY transcription factor 32 [Actinidia eriantha]